VERVNFKLVEVAVVAAAAQQTDDKRTNEQLRIDVIGTDKLVYIRLHCLVVLLALYHYMHQTRLELLDLAFFAFFAFSTFCFIK
jgi:hypothetical protein